jgi:hypothetical protein
VIKRRGLEIARLRAANLNPVLRGWGSGPNRRFFAQFAREDALGLVHLFHQSPSWFLRC